MRFMLIVKGNKQSESGATPSKELMAAVGRFNDEMMKAGILLAAEGLHPTSNGSKVRIAGAKRTVIDGPFTEAKELIAGFWLIQVKSKEEAIEWVKRCPPLFEEPEEAEVEIRQVFEAADFPPEELAREEAMRRELEKRGRGL